MTYEHRIVAGLKARGWVLDQKDQSRYAAFTHPKANDYKLFVGPSGALRKGRCASQSRSLGAPGFSSAFYTAVLEAGDKAIVGELSTEEILAILDARAALDERKAAPLPHKFSMAY